MSQQRSELISVQVFFHFNASDIERCPLTSRLCLFISCSSCMFLMSWIQAYFDKSLSFPPAALLVFTVSSLWSLTDGLPSAFYYLMPTSSSHACITQPCILAYYMAHQICGTSLLQNVCVLSGLFPSSLQVGISRQFCHHNAQYSSET